MKTYKNIFLYSALVIAVFVITIPLLLLLIRGFTDRWAYPQLFPQELSLRGVRRLFKVNFHVGRIIVSSIALSCVIALLSAVIAAMTARAFCFYEFKGKRILRFFSILPILVPVTAFGMGSQLLFIRLHLNNTIFAVIISHLIIVLPFAIKIMEDVISAVGTKLEEQARVLGASAWQAFACTTLQMIAPGVLSAIAVSFLLSYTQYFITLLIGGGNVRTLSIIVMPIISGNDQTLSSIYSVVFIVSIMFVFIVFHIASGVISKKCGGNFYGT
ncbi:MAG: spermidine/putrescine ABC transporter permease PotC [Termitinemataceae bacterium]|nr:MAG: spermidine/putrescine ABC transporter permease PotC [Termitinemataceae bacterium]